MQEALLSIGKQHGSIVDDFLFAAHTACPTLAVSLIAISIGALCFTDHSEKLFFCGKKSAEKCFTLRIVNHKTPSASQFLA